MGILITTIFYINFTKEEIALKSNILSEMRICNFDLKCEKFKIDFVTVGKKDYHTLYQNEDALYAQFPITGANKNALKVSFSQSSFSQALWKIQRELLIEYLMMMFVVLLLATGFAYVSLRPLRKSLQQTQEFVKDILHDFNTPLSTIRLNTSMLKREIPNNDKVDRIEKSVSSVLHLQSHLKAYLNNSQNEKEHLQLSKLLKENISLLEKNHPNISFYSDLNDCELYTYKDAFMRIIDNLLSNAVKYNKHNGSVSIIYKNSTKILEIKDTGKGIKEPSKIFNRFYKEQERGMGIGLNIVKKLCEELNITISVESKIGIGSSFYLNISPLLTSSK